MNRQLLLLRHAKSAWPAEVADLDRPLAPRGERDTNLVGGYLARRGLLPDHVVASPARRAQETARRVLAAAGSTCPVTTDRELYEGDVVQVLREVPEGARRALLVGHEPDLGLLAARMIGAAPGSISLRKAGLALLDFGAGGHGSDSPLGQAGLRLLLSPRSLLA